ncbi:MAG TPA: 2-amino-4-hydroxy-6-hydroxymethyldihydropteridine diphosphokinase [Bacteroidetes bacterium]|nr:2-amino-4-hydroxy-6-hydroxymethyldihydropteridine diphosphokinase [Bacteroidota bacterium]
MQNWLFVFIFKIVSFDIIIDTISMSVVCLLLGSNLGDRYAQMEKAEDLLCRTTGKKLTASGYYRSPPWGFASRNDFLNRALLFDTVLSPREVMFNCLETEKKLGRLRNTTGYADRIIDIDILFYDDLIIHEPGITIPHPRLEERRFALAPVAEIAPGWKHPLLGKNAVALLEQCPDHSEVIPWEPDQG